MVIRTFLLIIMVSVNISSQNISEIFNSANRSYQQKNYSKAVLLYEELVNEGYEGTSLYYNLGNAYYRMGKIGYAILYYEKALKLSPSDEDIIHNLKIANAATADKLTEFPPFFIFALWEDLLGIFSLSGWIYAGYIFFVLFLCFIAGYLLLNNPVYQKYSFIASIVIGILLIFSITLSVVKFNGEVNITKGIVVSGQSNVKISPDDGSNDAFIIHEGLKVKLEDKIDDWVRIKLEDGKTGWVPESNIEII